jgi:DNA-binding FrmR family transcriptional regulator
MVLMLVMIVFTAAVTRLWSPSGAAAVIRFGGRLRIAGRVGNELGFAASTAEQDLMALMRCAMRRIRLHRHAADGILQDRFVRMITGHGRPPGLFLWSDVYTLGGYQFKYPGGVYMDKAVSQKVLKNLNRVEGQVRGIAKMVEEDRYCIDVVTQIEAARAALSRIESDLLRQHLGHCVHRAMNSKNASEQEKVIEELVGVFRR